jgi:hypothetical protein
MSEQGLRARVAKLYASAHLRYTREALPVSFLSEMRSAGPMLVIMPREAAHFEAARHVLPFLRRVTSGEDGPVCVHAYLHETYKNWIDSRLISAALAWNDRDLNLLKLPGNKLLNRVAELGCGVAIDLNLDEDLRAAYVCGITGARVRMCIGRRGAAPYYNLEIDIPVARDDLKLTYDTFVRQLRLSFFPGQGLPSEEDPTW